ncbi:helix-turn-helix domain-containing protein, partial [Enterococcus faecalis]
MTIGEKIKSLRQSKDLTQSGLGELLNVSSQAVSNWERGKGYPDISNVIQISELFQVSLDILIKE